MKLVELNWNPTARQLRQFGAICLIASTATAQNWRGPGSLGLTVKSAKGKPLAGAIVTIAYREIGFGKTHAKVYDELTSEHPIDLVRYQVANCFMGRAGLINSGGASSGADDLAQAVRTAVINKRAGGMGMISGRKAFQRPMREGVELLNAIQDVYLSSQVTIA